MSLLGKLDEAGPAALPVVSSRDDRPGSSLDPAGVPVQMFKLEKGVTPITMQDGGLPVFLQEPTDVYYIVKGKPATITCIIASAIQVGY